MADGAAAASVLDLDGIVLPDRIRVAVPADAPEILRLVRELADYEREPDAVENTVERLERWLFGPDAVAAALIAEVDGRAVGTAVFYRTYSTWTGVPGLHLEDLFVEEGHRGAGLGAAFFAALAAIAVARGCARLEWVVLDWNTSAIGFYERLGGRRLEGWSTYRLTGRELGALAGTGDR